MNNSVGASSALSQFIIVLIIFIGVLVLTYAVTRWVSGYQKGRRAGSNIQFLESAGIGNNKFIQIVQIGSKYIAIAVSKDSVTFLTELSEDELHLPEVKEGEFKSFKDILSKAGSFGKDSGESENSTELSENENG